MSFRSAILSGFLLLTSSAAIGQEFRTIDGSDNNQTVSQLGSAGEELRRVTTPDYGDGQSTPAGASRESARAVSNAVCAQSSSVRNSQGASDYIWQWGQFLDHDIDLTPGHSPAEAFPIPVPLGDPFFDPGSTGMEEIPLFRSIYNVASNPRQQLNIITAWIDGSNVYGSDDARALELRTNDGTGRLKTSVGDLLPFNVNGFPNAQPGGADPADFFLAGDERANEQVALTAMHTLFMREHNRLADEIALANPMFTGDEIYLHARRIVGALMQKITYDEFLPVLLGPGALDPYSGYDDTVDPQITNVFSTACYRLGHSMLSSTLQRLTDPGEPIPEGNLALANGFFNPAAITDEGGIEPLLLGLAKQPAQEVDTKVIDAVRNFLFGPPGSGGFDLASLNIQRGRDHGLPSYNQTRLDFGLPAQLSFADVTSDVALQAALASVYATVDDIDVWVGSLAEDQIPGTMVGELLFTVIRDQFEVLRDGDRFWYQIDLMGQELADVEATSLSDVIQRNTNIQNIQENVFLIEFSQFTRGDCNNDALYNLADPIWTINYLFQTGPGNNCDDACDANDDGELNLSDAIFSITAIIINGPQPTAPHPSCGDDPTDDDLGCAGFAPCP